MGKIGVTYLVGLKLILCAGLFAQNSEPDSINASSLKPASVEISKQKHYEAKDFSYLFGMPGFSDNALNLHFTLYKGYVKNANLLLDTLAEYNTKGDTKSPEYSELKRRLGWEFDGMRLHELYFENLGKQLPLDPGSSLHADLVQNFGSYDLWKNDFVSTGAMRGIGWVVLYRDPVSGRLVNMWINEHDVGHLTGGSPLLVMDVFEHAYLPDYQLDRAKYIDAFFQNINWEIIEKRSAKTLLDMPAPAAS
ncbi:MAG: superoxide dismutase [Chlamydiales bacterium]|nr:superoxide dismutase [Chlamydiales bacterium]